MRGPTSNGKPRPERGHPRRTEAVLAELPWLPWDSSERGALAAKSERGLCRDDQLTAVRLVLVDVFGPGGLRLGVVAEQVIVEAEFVRRHFVARRRIGFVGLARQVLGNV